MLPVARSSRKGKERARFPQSAFRVQEPVPPFESGEEQGLLVALRGRVPILERVARGPLCLGGCAVGIAMALQMLWFSSGFDSL